jgi:hypothetical protein
MENLVWFSPTTHFTETHSTDKKFHRRKISPTENFTEGKFHRRQISPTMKNFTDIFIIFFFEFSRKFIIFKVYIFFKLWSANFELTVFRSRKMIPKCCNLNFWKICMGEICRRWNFPSVKFFVGEIFRRWNFCRWNGP